MFHQNIWSVIIEGDHHCRSWVQTYLSMSAKEPMSLYWDLVSQSILYSTQEILVVFVVFKVNMLIKDRLSQFSMQHILSVTHVFVWIESRNRMCLAEQDINFWEEKNSLES